MIAIRNAFGIELSLRILFDVPRLEAMAACIRNAKAALDVDGSMEEVQW
jgi:hypothetical protein